MSLENKYTVIELSDKLAVPRTTITDWLARYGAFIDFRIQGKRKIYTDKSVEVLIEIKGLRDKGLSSFDIEEELAKRHPIYGEFSISAEDKTKTGANAAKKTPEPSQNAQMINRQSGNTDIGEMLRNMIVEMTRRMDELEQQSRLNLERTAKWNIAAFATILMLAAVSVFGFLMIRNISEEKESLNQEKQQYLSLSQSLSNDLKDAKNEKKLMEQNVFEINGDRSLLKTELEMLKNNIEKQKGEFENALKNSMRDSEGAKEAEILKLRDKFAEERLKFLEALYKARNNREEMAMLVARLQAQNYEQENIIENVLDTKSAEVETEKTPKLE